MYNFAALPKYDWVTDYGYRRHINEYRPNRQLGTYYQQEKSHKSLLELIKYMDEGARDQTIAYFDLPADAHPFIMWVYAWVAYKDELPEGVHQDDIFPYEQLYNIYQNEHRQYPDGTKRNTNVNVYQDRIAESKDGHVLAAIE